jgi:RND superfamily putative drug exporter
MKGNNLQRFGGWIVNNRRTVLIIWVILVALGLCFAPKVDGILLGGTHLYGTDSESVSQILQDDFGNRYGNELVVVFYSPTRNAEDSGFRDAVSMIQLDLRQSSVVDNITTYYDNSSSDMIGKDGHSVLGIIELNVTDSNAVQKKVNELRTIAAKNKPDWMKLYTVGEGATFYDLSHSAARDLIKAESYSFPIVIVVLILSFGALLAAGIPVLLGLVAVSIALAVIYFTGQAMPIHITAKNTVSMIGLGVGIDYSLFMISRFREELKQGLTKEKAAAAILATSGKTVIFSGCTVIIGLSALFLAGFQVTNSLAISAILVVLFAILAAITLLPAVLCLLGTSINWPLSLSNWISRTKTGRFWHRLAMAVMKKPVVFLIATLLFFLWIAGSLFHIRTYTPTLAGLPNGCESRNGLEQLKKDFVAGKMTPINIIVEAPKGQSIWSKDTVTRIYQLSRRLASDKRVSKVEGIVDVDPKLTLNDYVKMYCDQSLETSDSIFTQMVSSYVDSSGENRKTILRVVTYDEPGAQNSRSVIESFRNEMVPEIFGMSPHNLGRNDHEYHVLVGGGSAFEVDLDQLLLGKLPWIIGFVCLATFVMMIFLFHSILIPLKSILMNLLSVMASFGLLVSVFQDNVLRGFMGIKSMGGVSSLVLVMLFAALFGLSMDYEIFLTARIKEEHDQGHNNEESVALGLERTAGLITSAALIMVTVFGAFVFTSMPTVQELGFGLAVAVFLDASIIRILLMPAMMRLLGEWNWWFPKKLERFLPRIELHE